MPNRFQINTPMSFQRWSLGANAIAGGFARHGGATWKMANDHFFAETQRFVHVVSGDLKRSGHHDIHTQQNRVVATVEYGGEGVDYAAYELNRGGSHDFLALGWEASQDVFQAAFGDTWKRVVESWN